MKKQMLVINIISILILSISCQKDEPIIQDPPDIECCEDKKDTAKQIPFLNSIWNIHVLKEIDNERQWFLNYGIINTPHGVAVNYDGQSARGVTMFDNNNGSIKWSWTHDAYMVSFHYHKSSDKLILHDWYETFVMDCKNGSVLSGFHQTKDRVSNPYSQLIGDHLYYSRLNNEDTKAWIVRSHVSDLQNWEVLYTIEKSQVGGSNPNIQSYNLWTDPISNDEILIFQHRMSLPNRVDLVGYNLTADTIAWKHNDLCPNGKSNVQQIQIFKDKAYFLGVNTIYCVDVRNGEIVWMDRHLEPLRGYILGDLVYAENEGLIVVKDDETRLTAYEPESGNVVWEITDLPHNGVDISYFDGYVYLANHPLIAVDVRTGEIYKETKLSEIYDGMIAIDEENRQLFATDFFSLYAFEIEE